MSTTNYVGGKLKLKGAALKVTGSGDKKKKKKALLDSALVALQDGSGPTSPTDATSPTGAELKGSLTGRPLPPKSIEEDRRTEAQKRYDEKRRKLEEGQIAKLAAKSHRERIKDFNDYLGNLSEHHDIPKVGPG